MGLEHRYSLAEIFGLPKGWPERYESVGAEPVDCQATMARPEA